MNVEVDRIAGEQSFLSKPQETDYPSSGSELYKGAMTISRGMKKHMEEMWSRHGSYGYDHYVTKKFG